MKAANTSRYPYMLRLSAEEIGALIEYHLQRARDCPSDMDWRQLRVRVLTEVCP